MNRMTVTLFNFLFLLLLTPLLTECGEAEQTPSAAIAEAEIAIAEAEKAEAAAEKAKAEAKTNIQTQLSYTGVLEDC